MAIRKLLLPLTGTEAGEAALATALLAARRWGAHLTALHVRADRGELVVMAGEGLSGTMIDEMMAASVREAAHRAAAVRELFDRVIAAQQVEIAPPRPGCTVATADFVGATGREDDRVAQQARLADLTVVPRPDAGEDVSSSEALHAVLFDSGRPVLICPRLAPATLGERICLAWSGTAGAAAARFAIPWMRRAETVTILTAREYQRRGPGAEELAAYLALHDIAASLSPFAPLERDVGAGMLAAARVAGADLLVIGAYSSSRLRQMILGGVTRHVIEHAELPVLMCR